jgi:8-oxo-dGTP pyrophosphatase MutT (NUDIX family)
LFVTDVEPWDRLNSEYLGDYRIFRLRQDRSVSPRTGATHTFFVLEAPNWINVLPITPEGKILMVRQYRHGRGEVTLEIPAGMCDPGEKDPALSARRELLEETGYVPERLIHIGTVTPNPAFLDNACYTFLAQDVRPVGGQQLVGAEDIALALLDFDAIDDLVANGGIRHSLTLNALFWYERFRRRGE